MHWHLVLAVRSSSCLEVISWWDHAVTLNSHSVKSVTFLRGRIDSESDIKTQSDPHEISMPLLLEGCKVGTEDTPHWMKQLPTDKSFTFWCVLTQLDVSKRYSAAHDPLSTPGFRIGFYRVPVVVRFLVHCCRLSLFKFLLGFWAVVNKCGHVVACLEPCPGGIHLQATGIFLFF